MTQTDGEKELVLGNKQLISLFFVVVALCGVFFAMGYMIGRNTSKPATASAEGNAPSATAAQAAPSPAQESEPPRETAAEEPPPPSPAPADSAQPAAVTPAAAVPVASTPSASTRTQAAQDTPAASDTGAAWLQVTALRRADADNLVKTLREQNFPAVRADSSKPDLFRVLVGPYHQTADVADAKARLKSLGFANAFVQK
jgi:cell division septation protein DedD